MMVDFFVVGAARSGTTSVYNYFANHPQVFLPGVKECNYFSEVESMDFEVYHLPEANKQYHMKIIKSYEVYKSLFDKASKDQIKGEVSPSYLWDKNTAKKIHEHNPNAKIIITLRNPIKRAYSHYLMHYNTGYEKQDSFEKAIKSDKIDIWGGGNQYLEMGLYYQQLKPYFDVFNKENIKVIIYEDWTKNIHTELNDICKFIQVDDFKSFDFALQHNETVNIKNRKLINFLRQKKLKTLLNQILSEELKQKVKQLVFSDNSVRKTINQETYNSLQSYYKEDVEKLENLLNLPLSKIWKLKYD